MDQTQKFEQHMVGFVLEILPCRLFATFHVIALALASSDTEYSCTKS
jgi:hypothetical protein